MKTSIRDESLCPSKETTDKIIRHHVWGAAGVGLIPLPLADFALLTGIQLNMLRKIAEIYHIPFRKDKVKNILSSLIGAAFPSAVSGMLAASIAKTVPLIGQTAGAATMPLIAGAVTYSVGKVFVQHFASGGTFLTFDPEEVRAYYADMLKEGEAAVKTSGLTAYSDSRAADARVESLDNAAEALAEESVALPKESDELSDSSSKESKSDFAEEKPPASDDRYALSEQGYGSGPSSYPDSGYQMKDSSDSTVPMSYSDDSAIAEGGMTDIPKSKRKRKKKKEIS